LNKIKFVWEFEMARKSQKTFLWLVNTFELSLVCSDCRN